MHHPLIKGSSLLSLCLSDPPDWTDTDEWTLCRAGSAREAMQAFRGGREVALLLSSMNIPDMPLWPLISRIRALRPRQPWMLVDKQIDENDEIRARSLGALMVLEEVPGQSELRPLLEALRRARPKVESG